MLPRALETHISSVWKKKSQWRDKTSWVPAQDEPTQCPADEGDDIQWGEGVLQKELFNLTAAIVSILTVMY